MDGLHAVKKPNWNQINKEVREIKTQVGEDIPAVERIEAVYSSILKQIERIHKDNTVIEVKKKRRRKHKPWVTEKIITECQVRDKLFKKARNHPCNADYRNKFEQQKGIVRKLIKETKEKYYNNLFGMHNI